MVPRLKEKYTKEVVPALKEQLALPNVNEVPRLEKIVVNMGVGAAVLDVKQLDVAIEDLRQITGQAAHHHAGQEVDRRLQDPPGHAHRREGHAAWCPHVGVHGPAALDRHPARP